MRRTTCTYHCSACGHHFHSLKAFDMHRQGEFASNDPEVGRHCVSPWDLFNEAGEMRLARLTEHGVCAAYELQEPITVWTEAGALERAREAWGEAA